MTNGRSKKIFFRVDGSEKIGLGHMVRSSALASALNQNYQCILATRCRIPKVLQEASDVYDDIVELPETDLRSEAAAASEIFSNADLVVLDGYAFDAAYQRELLKQKFDFFSIDDIHATEFYSRAVINHSGGLTPVDYHSQPGTQFFLGPRYSLLRKPFLSAAKKRRQSIDNKDCFVCFGGADPSNKTLEILKTEDILDQFDHFHVVTGSAYQHQEELMEFSSSKKNVSTYSSLSSEELVSVMQKTCFAICSPSTLVYEYMSVGGVVFLEQIADNQKDVIKYMVAEELAFLVKDIGHVDEDKIHLSLKKQSLYFDGRSDERFIKIFDQYFYGREIEVRRANESDLQICFEWANDTTVREQSYSQKPISLQEHSDWFHQKLNDPNSFFYIMDIDQKPSAQIRFQVNGTDAVLGYLLDAKMRNKGLGTTVLSLGIEKFIQDLQRPVNIIGYVKNANIPSQHSFEKLAFVKMISTEYADSFKYTMHYGN